MTTEIDLMTSAEIARIESKLSQPLDQSRVKTRQGPNNKPVSYVEGWDVIEALNENFGFLGWSRETVVCDRLHPPKMIEDPDSPERGKVVAAYYAKARITVYAGERTVIREGTAAARSFARTASEAEEQAMKSAETDAMKRAAITFGNQFGLALYDKSGKSIGRASRRQQLEAPRERPMAPIDEGFDAPARPTNSERALAMATSVPKSNGSGMRY